MEKERAISPVLPSSLAASAGGRDSQFTVPTSKSVFKYSIWKKCHGKKIQDYKEKLSNVVENDIVS